MGNCHKCKVRDNCGRMGYKERRAYDAKEGTWARSVLRQYVLLSMQTTAKQPLWC